MAKKKETVLSVLKEIRDYWKVDVHVKHEIKIRASVRFIKNSDGTVTDVSTGLMWGPTLSGEMKHADAEKTCKEFSLGAHKDWRLPTVKELASLVDYEKRDPAIDISFFPDTKSSWYWTATPVVGCTGFAWFVTFGYGNVSSYGKYNSGSVRPVRSSQ